MTTSLQKGDQVSLNMDILSVFILQGYRGFLRVILLFLKEKEDLLLKSGFEQIMEILSSLVESKIFRTNEGNSFLDDFFKNLE